MHTHSCRTILRALSDDRVLLVVLVVLCGATTLAMLALKTPLYADNHALGPHTLALFLPYTASAAFLMLLASTDRLDTRWLVAACSLAALPTISVWDLWFTPIVHHSGDDSFFYSTYAHYMLDNHTLWGGDVLLHGTRHYHDQPGYRYFLALMILVSGGENRLLQMANMIILAACAAFAISAVRKAFADRRYTVLFGIFLAASAPYAAKNVLYGYTEWLTAAFFLAFVGLYLRNRFLAAILVLALIPFLRQNLLLVALILALLTCLAARRWALLLPFVAVLLLPVYHNLYYADELRFFVSNRGTRFEATGNLGADAVQLLGLIASKIPHYFGYHPGEKLSTNLIAALFAPLGSGILLYFLTQLRGGARAIYLAAAAVTIGPTLIFGWGSFPRFVFLNDYAVMLSFFAVRSFADHGWRAAAENRNETVGRPHQTAAGE